MPQRALQNNRARKRAEPFKLLPKAPQSDAKNELENKHHQNGQMNDFYTKILAQLFEASLGSLFENASRMPVDPQSHARLAKEN